LTPTALLTGVLAPVITPFRADLSPDVERYVRHCRWLLANGCSGLAVFGTNSEANSLSVDERIALLDALLEAGVPAARLMPGTGCCALPDSVRLTAYAVEQGCAGVLMLPPFFYKNVPDEGLYRNFAEVVQRVGDARLRIYLYHIPPVSAVGFSLAVVERLLRDYPGTVVGMKDSSGDWSNMERMLKGFPGFQFFPGSEEFLLPAMRLGAVGTITATANIGPAAIDRLYRNWLSPEADAMQAAITDFRKAIVKFPQIPALKYTTAIYTGHPQWAMTRPPLQPLGEAQGRELRAMLEARGFDMPGIRD
jgi:4-hydroxy-tetrahydrodipicolinate synthase